MDCDALKVVGTLDNGSNQNQPEDVWSMPNWPARREKIFVECLIQEIDRIGVVVSCLSVEAWDRTEFNKEAGVDFDKMELKKHRGVLKKRYTIVKPPYDESGHGWDHHRKMPVIGDDVWEEIIEKYGCPRYEDLCFIFSEVMATGKYAMAFGGLSPGRAKRNRNISAGAEKRQSTHQIIYIPIKKNRTEAENVNPNATAEPKCEAPDIDPYSAVCCIGIINEMQGVDHCLYNVAIDLFKNTTWRILVFH